MKLYHASDIVIENSDVYHSRERINMYFRITYIL